MSILQTVLTTEPEDFIDVQTKVAYLAIQGLGTDGGAHKQWYLEEILKTVGISMEELIGVVEELCIGAYYEKGVAPSETGDEEERWVDISRIWRL